MILHPFDCSPTDPIGGKARSLASLTQAGFAIPSWFVITPGEFTLPPLEGRLAVRSSAAAEDGSEHSFAGQFESYLNIAPDDVATHVEKVRQSATSAHLDTYTREHDRPKAEAVSVIVQTMVDAAFAGVAFGADPVTGDRSRVLISAVAGLGDRLVSGECDSENWHCDSDKIIHGKSTLLTPTQIRDIATLCRACNAHFGSPQDIEWAIDRTGKLWLLQSRPITNLAHLPDPADPLTVWDNSNIAESYGGITLPLTFSFASRIYEHVYREFCKILSVPSWKIEANHHVFPRMLGHIQGQVYYNLVSWYRVLALLPGFSINRSFMEQMMGVKQPLPEEIVEKIVAENRTNRWRDGLALAKTGLGLLRNFLTLPRQIKRFQSRLDAALSTEKSLSEFSTPQLIAHYHELESQLLRRWDAPLVNDFFAMIFYGLLAKGDKNADAHLEGAGGIISARPPRLIRAMADLARKIPGLPELLLSDQSTARRLQALRENQELAKLFQDYLDEFGDRCLEELKLESPTLFDDPSSLLQSIGSFALHPKQPNSSKSRTSPSRPPFFKRLLIRKTQQLVRNRENLRFERTRVFGRVRQIMRELGHRLHTDRQLEDPEDVFDLTLTEVLDQDRSLDYRGLVASRQAQFSNYRQSLPPPDRFSSRGPLHRHREFQGELSAPDPASDLSGIGACAGRVRGRVRVVKNPRDTQLQPGEILVAPQTDPGWVVLFPAAAGLLVERGSLLSHSAIVARELSLPCIVSVPHVTTRLKTGDEIEMDGQTGTITLL